MKRKVGTLRGRVVIEGDKNLQTTNEIHVKDLENKEGGGRDEYLYYKLDASEINEKGGFDDISEDCIIAVEVFAFSNVPTVIREGKELRSISIYDSSGGGYNQYSFYNEATFAAFDFHSKYVYFKLYKNWNTAEVTRSFEITNILNVAGTIDEQMFTLMNITEESQKAPFREAINKYITQITKEEYEAQITK